MTRPINILFLCTGNACRSQMAEGWARALKPGLLIAHSAGTSPHGLNPLAARAMAEAGVDISSHHSKHVNDLLAELGPDTLDIVITVCAAAHESCPLFPGAARIVHHGFEDPPKLAAAAHATTDDQAMPHYRRIRDEIRAYIQTLPGALPDAIIASTT